MYVYVYTFNEHVCLNKYIFILYTCIYAHIYVHLFIAIYVHICGFTYFFLFIQFIYQIYNKFANIADRI